MLDPILLGASPCLSPQTALIILAFSFPNATGPLHKLVFMPEGLSSPSQVLILQLSAQAYLPQRSLP